MSAEKPEQPDKPLIVRDRLAGWIFAVLVAALIIGLGVKTVLVGAVYSKHRTDFLVYQLAGKAVLDGVDFYTVEDPHGWKYIYPPPFAILMVPFALLPLFWAVLIWYALSVALTLWAVQMCVTMVRDSLKFSRHPLWLYALPTFLVLGWYMSAVTRGQASVILLWLVIAAIFWQWKGRETPAAICLAGAVLLKVFPVLLLGYFAWRRRWRFLIIALLAIAVGALVLPAAVLGWQKNCAYLGEWVTIVGKPAMQAQDTHTDSDLHEQLLNLDLLRNQSLQSVLWRLTDSPHARELAALLAVVMAGAIFMVGRKARPADEPLILSAFLGWMLLVPPVSWSHYFILLLVPLAALLTVAVETADTTRRRLAISTLIGFGVASYVSIIIKPVEFYGLLCWTTVGVVGALLFAAHRRAREA